MRWGTGEYIQDDYVPPFPSCRYSDFLGALLEPEHQSQAKVIAIETRAPVCDDNPEVLVTLVRCILVCYPLQIDLETGP